MLSPQLLLVCGLYRLLLMRCLHLWAKEALLPKVICTSAMIALRVLSTHPGLRFHRTGRGWNNLLPGPESGKSLLIHSVKGAGAVVVAATATVAPQRVLRSISP